MNDNVKITLLTFVFSIIWITLGLTFVSAEPLNYKLVNYFYYAIPYILFLFLPISILLFSQSAKLKKVSWIFIIVSAFIILNGFISYFSVSDFQKNASLFDFIYTVIRIVPLLPMYLFIMFGATT